MKVMKRIICIILAVILVGSMPQMILGKEEGLGDSLDYAQFRGTALSPGVLGSKTPQSKEAIEEKWARKLGSGWSSACGTPIVVKEYLYVLAISEKKLHRISLETGETLQAVDCPGESQFFSTIAYADGMIFVPRSIKVTVPDPINSEKTVSRTASVIYAYAEETMEMLWVTEPIGNVYDALQPLSPVLCHNGYIYMGVSYANASKGAFACFDTKDTASAGQDEPKKAIWTYTPETGVSGYYWSGGAIVNDTIVFGGEKGELVIHSLDQDIIYDRLQLPANALGIRSTIHYDGKTNRIYTTTKGGYLYSVKIDGSRMFDKSSLIYAKLDNDITSSPVVCNGRLYVGGGGISSAAGFSVLDAETLEMIYQIREIKSQSSPILTTAYATEENQWQVYLYMIQYNTPSALYVISDKQGQTEPKWETLLTPSQPQYCSQSVAIDKDGTLYFNNDSAHIFAVGHKTAEDGLYTALDIDKGISFLYKTGSISLREEPRIQALLARYQALGTEEQKKVTQYPQLLSLQEKVQQLKDEESVIADLNVKIEAIDIAAISLQDAFIVQLYTQYNTLSAKGKERITDAEKLILAVAKLQALKDESAIAEIQKKIEDLPQPESVTYDDRDAVETVAALLESQNDAVRAGIQDAKLNELNRRISAIRAEIEQLNIRIFIEINPLQITVQDKETVNQLILMYQKLDQRDHKYIRYYEDVLMAERVIKGLEAGTILPEIFGNMLGTDTIYTVQGRTDSGADYSISFDSTKIIAPSNGFELGLSFKSQKKDAVLALASDAFLLQFRHQGMFPGRAKVQVHTGMSDGRYYLYYWNESSNQPEKLCQLEVKNGTATFAITRGSLYFLSQTEIGKNNTETENPETGEVFHGEILTGISLLGAVILLSRRKRKVVP